ncbi:MAG TPA: cytochrome c1 [Methylocystis sp.]|nr:cytochrome c1 [Methylocystis sp.]
MSKPCLSKLRMAAILLALAAPTSLRAEATKVEPEEHPIQFEWSFAGVMGRYDLAQLKRGFKIFREVCSSCHSMQLVAFRSLGGAGGLGYSEEEVKTLAASYKIKDGPNDKGEYFERPGRPSDYFPSPFANEQAARTALNGGYPPDMSVLAKARGYHRGFPTFLLDALPGLSYQEAGVDYIASLLQGYRDAPSGMTIPDGQFYNVYMPGRRIGMVPPLADGAVTYDDGAPQTVSQYAKDVSAFLMWAAEPHLDQRKSIGRGVLVFLAVFAVLLYFVKREIWSNVDH